MRRAVSTAAATEKDVAVAPFGTRNLSHQKKYMGSDLPENKCLRWSSLPCVARSES